jgi:hypothetical protein
LVDALSVVVTEAVTPPAKPPLLELPTVVVPVGVKPTSEENALGALLFWYGGLAGELFVVPAKYAQA